MKVLKVIGYLIAAIMVLTVLVTGGLFIVALAIAGGLILSLITTVIFTASSIRAYFEN